MSKQIITEYLPRVLIRTGIAISLACIGLFFFIAWLLEYKDTLEGKITITTTSMPVDIHANATGKLLLMQPNKQMVRKGMKLAYIENSADLAPCLWLADTLSTAVSASSIIELVPALSKKLKGANIGSIQPKFVELTKRYKAYQFFLKTDKHQTLIATKEEQIGLHEQHIQLSQKKIDLHQKNLLLAQKQLATDQQLFDENIISQRQLEQAKQAYNELEVSGRLIDFQTAISNANIQIAQQQEAILQLENSYVQSKEQLYTAVLDAYQLVNKEVNDWKDQYLICADMEGQLIYSESLIDYTFTQKGMKLMTILPDEEQQYLGLLQLPMVGFSKLKKDQMVQIRLDHYPYEEYGILQGRVLAYSPIPNEENHLVQVDFPNGLRSSYNFDFTFTQRMVGKAAVVTNRMSIWQRMKNQIRSAQLNN